MKKESALDVAYLATVLVAITLRGTSPTLTLVSTILLALAAVPLAIRFGSNDWRALLALTVLFWVTGLVPLFFRLRYLTVILLAHSAAPWIGWAIWGRKATSGSKNIGGST